MKTLLNATQGMNALQIIMAIMFLMAMALMILGLIIMAWNAIASKLKEMDDKDRGGFGPIKQKVNSFKPDADLEDAKDAVKSFSLLIVCGIIVNVIVTIVGN